MRRSIQVHVGETPRLLGTLHFDTQGTRESSAFEYHPDWLSAADRFAAAPGLPLVTGLQFHRKTPQGSAFSGVIADTEPDGWSRRVILRDQAKRRQAARRAGVAETAPVLTSLDFLLAVDDSSRVGALRYRDEAGVFRRAPIEGGRSVPPLIEIGTLLSATRAFETSSETRTELEYLRGRATSLGGLRPKCVVRDDSGRLHVAKFPSVGDERAITKAEVLAMRLALEAGIQAAEARVIDGDGAPVALIRRFDRPDAGGRLMYASAATLIEAEPDDPGEHAYTEIVDAMRRHCVSPQTDIDELWRRIAFSILITNVDDHLRNHGFLHVARGQWQLAPAFDLNPFPDRVRALKTWISEESGPEASIDALMSATPYFRIAPGKARDMLARIEKAVARWRAEGRRLGMTSTELDAFAEAFEHEERAAAKRYAA